MALPTKVSIDVVPSTKVLIGLTRMDLFKGTFVENGKKHGFGRYVGSSGEEYVGEFKYDRPNGKGKQTWPNGVVYEGEYGDCSNCEGVHLIDSLSC